MNNFVLSFIYFIQILSHKWIFTPESDFKCLKNHPHNTKVTEYQEK